MGLLRNRLAENSLVPMFLIKRRMVQDRAILLFVYSAAQLPQIKKLLRFTKPEEKVAFQYIHSLMHTIVVRILDRGHSPYPS